MANPTSNSDRNGTAAVGENSEAEPLVLRSKTGFYSLLASLYCTQFLGIGFVQIGLTGILREQGVELEKLAYLNAMGIFWAIKFLWSPLVDSFGSRRFGHYRSWLLIMQPLMVAGLCVLALIPPIEPNFFLLITVLGFFVAFSATQDIAADALVVTLLPEGEQGFANGIQIAAGYIGNVVGGGLVVFIYDKFGWTPSVILLAVLTSISFFQALFNADAKRASRPEKLGLAKTYVRMFSLLKDQRVRRWAFIVVPLAYVGVSVPYTLLTPALVDNGWPLTRVGFVLAVVAGIPSAIGGAVSGWFINRWGLQRPLLIGNTLSAVGVAVLLPTFAGRASETVTIAAILLYLTAYSAASAVIYTINMKYCRKSTPGSDFTLLTCISMIFSFIGGGVFMALAGKIGYVPIAAASLGLIAVGTWATHRHISSDDFV